MEEGRKEGGGRGEGKGRQRGGSKGGKKGERGRKGGEGRRGEGKGREGGGGEGEGGGKGRAAKEKRKEIRTQRSLSKRTCGHWKVLSSRKGSLSATYKKNSEANTKLYDLSQKTMQAFHRLAGATFEDTWANLQNENSEGGILFAPKRMERWTSGQRLSNTRPVAGTM